MSSFNLVSGIPKTVSWPEITLPMSSNKPTLSFWQIWNMSFGFLGIQFGWNLQMANMSAIYDYLGASPEQVPLLFLAAPLTGLIIQPIIGYLSDRTWTPLGRRKPFFLVGAILSSLALLMMPNSSALWMAAGTLWILDASINISMEPFRAFVGDLLPKEQQTKGFTMQSFFIGLGSVVAACMPWFFAKMGVPDTAEEGAIPATVKYSFYAGAVVFIGAVLWTIRTTKEYPPEDMEAFRKEKEKGGGFADGVREIFDSISSMPKRMRQLALVQFFTWPGLFFMWFYFTTAVSYDVLGATDNTSELYAEGVAWGNLCFGFYSLITFAVAFAIPFVVKRIGVKQTHAIALVLGGLGLVSVMFIHSKELLLVSMAGVGVAWACILSLPYTMLVPSLNPKKLGIYMGIFNFFIVLPEIIASLFFGSFMENVLHNDRTLALALGGGLFFLAALLALRVDMTPETEFEAVGDER